MVEAMKKFVVPIIVALLAVASCEDKENVASPSPEKSYPSFFASIEGATKTFLGDDLQVCWNAADEINVFTPDNLSLRYSFSGSDGDSSGSFAFEEEIGNIDPVLDKTYAVYPFSEDNGVDADGNLLVNFEPFQSYQENSPGPESIMVAGSDDSSLAFKNVGGFLHLRLWGDVPPIDYIYIMGNNSEIISGNAIVSFDSDGLPVVSMKGDGDTDVFSAVADEKDYITIGKTLETATDFYLSLPPVTFSDGFKLSVIFEDGTKLTQISNNSLTISRNTRANMKPLELTIPENTTTEEDIEEMIEGEYTFNYSSAYDGTVFSDNLKIFAFDSEYGNSVMYGPLNILTSSSLPIFCDYNREEGTLTIPAGEDIGMFYTDATQTSVYVVRLFLSDDEDYLDDDIVFNVPAAHKLTFPAGYYISMVCFKKESADAEEEVYAGWYDDMVISSIDYVLTPSFIGRELGGAVSPLTLKKDFVPTKSFEGKTFSPSLSRR